jgi:hypothetical protein
VRELCNTLLSAYLIQLLDTGLLHADPHPGNLIRTGVLVACCVGGVRHCSALSSRLCISWIIDACKPPDVPPAVKQCMQSLIAWSDIG